MKFVIFITFRFVDDVLKLFQKRVVFISSRQRTKNNTHFRYMLNDLSRQVMVVVLFRNKSSKSSTISTHKINMSESNVSESNVSESNMSESNMSEKEDPLAAAQCLPCETRPAAE